MNLENISQRNNFLSGRVCSHSGQSAQVLGYPQQRPLFASSLGAAFAVKSTAFRQEQKQEAKQKLPCLGCLERMKPQ